MNKSESQPRRALGKGVGALLPTRPVPAPHPETAGQDAPYAVPIDSLDPNPLQPRRTFEPEKLEELAQSIRAHGIVQPLVVRQAGNRYQLVAGERRLRAAKLAGLQEVPVVVCDFPDASLLEITLIENIQREDLNPIETAMAFERMVVELNLNAEEIARRTGKDRTTIVNFRRLLHLPKDIQDLVAENKLSAGHARCLLALPGQTLQIAAAQRTIANAWSVRQLEQYVNKLKAEVSASPKPEPPPLDANVRAAIAEMERVLATTVRIVDKGRKGGQIEIEYYSPDDLQRLYTCIVGET